MWFLESLTAFEFAAAIAIAGIAIAGATAIAVALLAKCAQCGKRRDWCEDCAE